jgi:hypothetical protein
MGSESSFGSSGIGSFLDGWFAVYPFSIYFYFFVGDRVGMQHEEEAANAKATLDEDRTAIAEPTATTEGDKGGGEESPNETPNCRFPSPTPRFIPLLDHLCRKYDCNIQQLQLLLFNIEARRRIIAELREGFELRTTHLHPTTQNIQLRCDDFSCQTATNVFAFNGFLNITVRQYFFCKHKLSLRYPFLPCLIVFGGGKHRSYYPIEVIAVRKLTT